MFAIGAVKAVGFLYFFCGCSSLDVYNPTDQGSHQQWVVSEVYGYSEWYSVGESSISIVVFDADGHHCGRAGLISM